MSDEDPTINQQIAALMQQQTYADRMEMARWFRDVASDAVHDSTKLDGDWFAGAFATWADSELSDDDADSQP